MYNYMQVAPKLIFMMEKLHTSGITHSNTPSPLLARDRYELQQVQVVIPVVTQ